MANRKSLFVFCLVLFVLIGISAVSATNTNDTAVTSEDATPVIEEVNDADNAPVIEETNDDNVIESSQKAVKTADKNKETHENSDKNTIGSNNTPDFYVHYGDDGKINVVISNGEKGVTGNLTLYDANGVKIDGKVSYEKGDVAATATFNDGSAVISLDKLSLKDLLSSKMFYLDYTLDNITHIAKENSGFSSSISSALITEGDSLTVKLTGPKPSLFSNVHLVVDTTDTGYDFDGTFTKVIKNLSVGIHYIRISAIVDGAIYFKMYMVVVQPKTQAQTKIIASKKTFKSKTKTKKYTVTLKSGKTGVQKVWVYLTLKGKKYKKTFKAKTNNKGKAVFKIKKLTKKGTYTATIKFKANKAYKGTSKKVKITVKK